MAENIEDQVGVSSLQQLFGENVELNSADGTSQVFRILSELTVNGNRYAVLQSDEMEQEDEIDLYRIVVEPGGDLQLETITDEDEWEQVAEAYDDVQFGSDDQP